MTVATESSGTQTATVNTEHTLATPTTAKTRVLMVDLTNLVSGDTVELRIKAKVLTGGTAGLVYLATFIGPVGEPVAVSPPVPCPFGATLTLKQVAGTGRAYDWAGLTLD